VLEPTKLSIIIEFFQKCKVKMVIFDIDCEFWSLLLGKNISIKHECLYP